MVKKLEDMKYCNAVADDAWVTAFLGDRQLNTIVMQIGGGR